MEEEEKEVDGRVERTCWEEVEEDADEETKKGRETALSVTATKANGIVVGSLVVVVVVAQAPCGNQSVHSSPIVWSNNVQRSNGSLHQTQKPPPSGVKMAQLSHEVMTLQRFLCGGGFVLSAVVVVDVEGMGVVKGIDVVIAAALVAKIIETSGGDRMGVTDVCPVPSCPYSLLPQHRTPPLAVSAHVWLYPAAISTTPIITGVGTRRVFVVLSPSCPLVFLPQHHTLLSSWSAHTWFSPLESLSTLAITKTGFG